MSILETLASLPCIRSSRAAQTIIDELQGRGYEIRSCRAGPAAFSASSHAAEGKRDRASLIRMYAGEPDDWPALDP